MDITAKDKYKIRELGKLVVVFIIKKQIKLKANAIIYIMYGIAIFLQTRNTTNNATGRAYFNTAIIVIGY